MLNEEIKQFANLNNISIEQAYDVPISRIGGYLDGYEQGKQDAEKEYLLNTYGLTVKIADAEKQRIRTDAIGKIETRLEEELTMVMPRDDVKFLMYKVHTALEQWKGE